MFRMPVHFGPAPGPRNVPRDRQRTRYCNRRTVLSVTALCDERSLAKMLPEGCVLSGEPRLTVMVSRLTQLGWLAGRGYNIVTVQLPEVTCAGARASPTGTFVPVVWENLADPIITGREELGMAKLFADIPDAMAVGGAYACSAAWHGFRFFELEAHGFAATQPPSARAPATLLYKYLPRTGDWGAADAAYMTATGIDPNEPPVQLHAYSEGSGTFRFNPARWEDMPTQYPIVNALAAVPIERFLHASLKTTSQGEVDSVGGGNLCGQQAIS